MAAVVVGTVNPDVASARDFGRFKHFIVPVTVTTTGDTYDSGMQIGRVAWEPTDTSDPMAVTFSGDVVTFTGTNGSAGNLHIWALR